MTSCKWCGIPIFWNEEPQGYVPYEDQALTKRHDCPNKPTATGHDEAKAPGPDAKPVKKVPVKPLTDEEIIFVRKLRWQLKGLTEGATAP